MVAAKGAPEAIAEMCHLDVRQVTARTSAMAERGLRVLGVARARVYPGPLPRSQREFQFEFLGLVGLADPVRPTVPESVQECYDAGIRVVMITGDYPVTAQSIARQIGLSPAARSSPGTRSARIDDAELERRSRTVNVFARVVPEQKLRLVNALKAHGEIVAMTGDGVNDAPALKAATHRRGDGRTRHGRGARSRRACAAGRRLLVNRRGRSSLGRRIFDNLRKAMAYIFAIHVPIAGLSLIPILLGWPLDSPAGAHRLPGTDHRPRVLDRLRDAGARNAA